MITGIIYRYISPNGKCYVGQTTNELYRRRMWFGTGRYTGGISKIDRARKKYGAHNFKYEILFKRNFNSLEEATCELNKLESYYIGYFDTYYNGYNCTFGGDGSRGYIPTKETRIKISKAGKGIKRTDEFKKNVSKRLKGKVKSLEHRMKLSNSRKNSGHKILQYTIQGEYIRTWNNIDEVATSLGVSRESIAGCCRGKAKTTHKYKWKYKEDII